MHKKSLPEKIKKFIIKYCKYDVFSAASIAYLHGEYPYPEKGIVSIGKSGSMGDTVVTDNSLFDLASLTKPLVTLLSVLTLIERKELSWNTAVGDVLKDSGKNGNCFIYTLLSHRSGLPAHKEYWHDLKNMQDSEKKEWVKKQILSELHESRKSDQPLYSDLGYLLLGFIVETLTGDELSTFWKKEIAHPLGVENDLLFPTTQPKQREKYVMTGVGSWDNVLLQGVVNDDNCRALGGVCGHAGLFGTGRGVLKICQELLNLLKGKGHSLLPFSTETFRYACRQVGTTEWTAGFNLPTPGGSSSGIYFSEDSIGHLGFTGTSFWIDPKKDLIIILLTNRVIKGPSLEGIINLRPILHDYIVEQLGIAKK